LISDELKGAAMMQFRGGSGAPTSPTMPMTSKYRDYAKTTTKKMGTRLAMKRASSSHSLGLKEQKTLDGDKARDTQGAGVFMTAA